MLLSNILIALFMVLVLVVLFGILFLAIWILENRSERIGIIGIILWYCILVFGLILSICQVITLNS